jgi:predicted dehydrogenase
LNKSKIGIVGLGHWGKIILRNLRELGYNNITICETQPIQWELIGEKYPCVTDYKDLDCEYVFVIVPVAHHYEICKHFLEKGCKVFCEKPLDTDYNKCVELYEIADGNYGSDLFVDWLFTFNPAVNKIKSIISNIGKPKSIIANRMNFGPVRSDTNARWDLASHDVSIGCYLFDEKPGYQKWVDFKRNKNGKEHDSVVGILDFENTNMQINASWHYGAKNRMYIIEFENCFMHWDDNTSTILFGNEIIPVDKVSPLHASINTFFTRDWDVGKQNKLTLDITEVLTL